MTREGWRDGPPSCMDTLREGPYFSTENMGFGSPGSLWLLSAVYSLGDVWGVAQLGVGEENGGRVGQRVQWAGGTRLTAPSLDSGLKMGQGALDSEGWKATVPGDRSTGVWV